MNRSEQLSCSSLPAVTEWQLHMMSSMVLCRHTRGPHFVVTVPATAVLQHPATTVCKLLSAALVPMGLCQVYSGPQVYAQTHSLGSPTCFVPDTYDDARVSHGCSSLDRQCGCKGNRQSSKRGTRLPSPTYGHQTNGTALRLRTAA
jgi:hypothetical protein